MDQAPTRMSEAEVAIRLAEYLLSLPLAADQATVAIDGAVVASVDRGRIFEIERFLATRRWHLSQQQGRREWHGAYSRAGKQLHISSTSGTGDVVVQFGKRRVIAECKGGPLIKRPGSKEHRILKEALGQAVLWNGDHSDIMLVAVPDTQWFRPLAESWRQRPRVRKAGIQIALVSQSGDVSGFDLDEA